jgi:D-glycero-D-manno-heptose 1,7-bisphosphate phosphatase
LIVQKTVFLDRDGTVIRDKDYLSDPNEVELEAGAGDALRMLQENGYLLIVVTNQSGVARGFFSITEVDACNRRVDDILRPLGVTIDAWLVCPHGPGDACRCRKPLTGLIEQASLRFSIDIGHSFVIGDKDSDVLLGKAAGMQGVLVTTGSGLKHMDWAKKAGHPHFVNITDAVSYILSSETVG